MTVGWNAPAQRIIAAGCQYATEGRTSGDGRTSRQQVVRQAIPGVDYTPLPEYPDLYTPLSRDQLDMIQRVLVDEDDALHASVLLAAASYPDVMHSARDNTDEDLVGVAAIRALRPPAYVDLGAALRRIDRAVDSETEPCHQRRWKGHEDGKTALRAIGLRLLELGFTVAEASGLDCAAIESVVARTYGLPGHGS